MEPKQFTFFILLWMLLFQSGCFTYRNVTGKKGHFRELSKGDIIELTVPFEFIDNKGTDIIRPEGWDYPYCGLYENIVGQLESGDRIKFLGAYEFEVYMSPVRLSENGRIINGQFKGRKVSLHLLGKAKTDGINCYRIVSNSD